MTTELPVARRLSVPLTATDEEFLAHVRSDQGVDAREILRLASTSFSDAAFVRAVFELGIQKLREEQEFHIYKQMALDTEYVAETEAMRIHSTQVLTGRRDE